ncbi:hypothetical protein L5515_008729 [Caenorhabditis briggsae]|uniref:Uncharacterized protein n=1 Tax=Caenorhabditis briggsae TaxID=6238 RepID=A0AAE9D1S2_CAEBR|nr:hypothetical protein L3Y34_008891 [Caenorhabditis briggsae]UMM36668.1 hypothetical protein L5515_008729 [Caenorhabditis briggsae]
MTDGGWCWLEGQKEKTTTPRLTDECCESNTASSTLTNEKRMLVEHTRVCVKRNELVVDEWSFERMGIPNLFGILGRLERAVTSS